MPEDAQELKRAGTPTMPSQKWSHNLYFTSSTIDLSSGVGEGSVIGPTLYTLGQICVSVVCDITKNRLQLESNISVDTLSCEYADDVTGAIAAKNDEELQVATDMLMHQYGDYFSAAGLCLNQEKNNPALAQSGPDPAEIFLIILVILVKSMALQSSLNLSKFMELLPTSTDS